MNTEQAKTKIEETLLNMGCTDISFPVLENTSIVVVFNCREITSFVADISGWTYSGIHLDTTYGHQYGIDFRLKG